MVLAYRNLAELYFGIAESEGKIVFVLQIRPF
jgi:hypothetical protein